MKKPALPIPKTIMTRIKDLARKRKVPVESLVQELTTKAFETLMKEVDEELKRI